MKVASYVSLCILLYFCLFIWIITNVITCCLFFVCQNLSESDKPADIRETRFSHAGDDEQTSLWARRLFQQQISQVSSHGWVTAFIHYTFRLVLQYCLSSNCFLIEQVTGARSCWRTASITTLRTWVRQRRARPSRVRLNTGATSRRWGSRRRSKDEQTSESPFTEKTSRVRCPSTGEVWAML